MKCNAIRIWAGAVALGVTLAFGATAQASPQYALDCTSCHNMPPNDSGTASKNPFDGSVPGNHQGHATSSLDSCVICHGSQVTGYNTSHRNKTIELVDSFSYTRKVSGGGFLNQTSVPPATLGSCSSVACHSNGKGSYSSTPNWGRAPFQAPGDCSQCHGVAPSSGNHPSLTGAGQKHGNYFGTGTGSCVKCHSDHTAESKAFAHATSAGKRGIDVHFATGGSYANGQCSNLYCHSNGKGVYSPPTWGGTLDCSGCHGTATSNTLSGAHAKHVNNDSFLGTSYGCADCHAATASNNSTIADYTKHVNGSVDFGGSRVGTPASGSCSTAYCHSDGKGSQKSVNWTSGSTLDCKGCHGSDATPDFASTAGEPNYANAGSGQAKANSHKNHVISAASCQNCHASTTADGLSIVAGAPHTDGNIDVVAGNGKSFTIASKTCSNVSCHSGNGLLSNVAPASWGASLGCTGCHGDASTLNSYAHAKHVNAKGYACDTCHSATVSGSSTIIDHSLHGNGVRDVNSFFNATNTTCSVACHGSATPDWTNLATGGCGTCHNALSTTANGLIASNGHGTHFTGVYGPKLDGTTTNSCAICHVYSSDTAATHDNGTVDLNAGYAKSGTCGTCHTQSVTWSSTGRLACESCHTGTLSVINGVTAPDKSLAASAGHNRSGIDQSCVSCHDNTSAHIGVSGGTSRLLPALTGSANAECNYCHQDPAKVTPQHLNMQVHASTANSCALCHDPHGTTNSNMVKSTLASTSGITFSGSDFVNATGTGVCQSCHTQTLYYKQGGQENNHPSTGCLDCHAHNTPSGTAFEPNRACDSCHGYPPVPRNVSVSFGLHGQYSSARFEDYSGGGGAHVLASHLDPNVTPSMQWAPCLKCHNTGASSHQRIIPLKTHVENVTVKVDPQYRFSNDYFVSYTGAKFVSGGGNQSGRCFNVACHFQMTPKWSTER